MTINELYDSLDPLQQRFIGFCRTNGFETLYDLTFFNYFDLEYNDYKLEDIITLQNILYSCIRSLEIDTNHIKTRKQLKIVLDGIEVIAVKKKVAEIKPEVIEKVEVKPVHHEEIKAIDEDEYDLTSKFMELKELGKEYDDIYVANVSAFVPNYDRIQYKMLRVYTIGDYRHLSNRQLQQLFNHVTRTQFDAYLNLLYFITNIRSLIHEENESKSLFSVVDQSIYDICYANKVERYKDFRTIPKIVKVYESLSKTQKDDILIELGL